MVYGKTWQGMFFVLQTGFLFSTRAETLKESAGYEQHESLHNEAVIAQGNNLMPMPPFSEEPFKIESPEELQGKSKQNRPKGARSRLPMVLFRGEIVKGIKDDTSSTGENARKKLPGGLKRRETSSQGLYLEKLNHVIPQVTLATSPPK